MPTLGDVVTGISNRLGTGVGTYKDKVTELKEDVDSSSTTFTVTDPSGLAAGFYEIDAELVRAKSVAQADGTVTLWSFGRGQKGTVPTAHTHGVQVTADPLLPVAVVAAEVNGVLAELYGQGMYGVAQDEVLYDPMVPYTLPAAAVGVVAVFIKDRATQGWVRTDRWRFEPDTGNGLVIPEAYPSDTVRVVYAVEPGRFDLSASPVLAQSWATVTGLPDRVADLIALGVAYRLTPFVDAARVLVGSAEAKADGQAKPPGGGGTASRLLLAEFQSRVNQELTLLRQAHPIRAHRLR